MEISLKRLTADFSIKKLAGAALQPRGHGIKPNQLIRAAGLTGRRDPLTEFQQKILKAAIALIGETGKVDPVRTAYKMKVSDFLPLCEVAGEELYTYLVNEFEKLVKKGVWLFDEKRGMLTKAQWFQAVGFDDREIVFQFSEQILGLIASIEPDDTEYQLVKGIQYKGKHTMAVFEIIWSRKSEGVVEYSIPELMKALSLQHTRYSYGQLKLRVLEPSLQEIYDWDDEIFVRFGPTFSGRRAEGVWFEVTTGKAARELRDKEPQFRFAPPEDKPV